LNLLANICVNSTKSSVICKPKQIIDEYLKSVYFGLALKVNYINHQNTTNPFMEEFRLMSFFMSNTIFKQYYVSFKNVIYTTDLGMIFEDKLVQYDYVYGSQQLNVDLKLGTILSPAAFGQITLTADSIASEYKRSFTKLQTVLANAGGALKALQTFTLILCQLITKRLYFQEMINLNFTHKCEEPLKQIQDKSSTPIRLTNNFILKKENFESYMIDDRSKKLKLKFREKVCPFCVWTKRTKTFFQAGERRIINELSYENILKKLIQFDRLKNTVLTDTQLKIFEMLSRTCADKNKNYFEPLNFDEINFEDPVIKKLTSSMVNQN
jgi:hypothetical protein